MPTSFFIGALRYAGTRRFRVAGKISRRRYQGAAMVGEVRSKTAIIIDELISSGVTLHHAALVCRAARSVGICGSGRLRVLDSSDLLAYATLRRHTSCC
ncbi:MAG TPA: hypothetical protein VLC91_06485 [Spongiibacteraceae bacterium]|nr:hypothetical protein [Spongiibacteraceae bacterium]